MIRLKRAYDPPETVDGFRVLVDRLWPRGITKEGLAVDLWAKEIAPSHALRTSFAHEKGRFAEFARRYRLELQGPGARPLVEELRRRGDRGTVTLVYASRDALRNNAVVLKAELEGEARSPRAARARSRRERAEPARRQRAGPTRRTPSGSAARRPRRSRGETERGR